MRQMGGLSFGGDSSQKACRIGHFTDGKSTCGAGVFVVLEIFKKIFLIYASNGEKCGWRLCYTKDGNGESVTKKMILQG